MDLLSLRKRSFRRDMETIFVVRKFFIEWNEQCSPMLHSRQALEKSYQAK